jgi:hypothetical protein
MRTPARQRWRPGRRPCANLPQVVGQVANIEPIGSVFSFLGKSWPEAGKLDNGNGASGAMQLLRDALPVLVTGFVVIEYLSV